MRLKQIKLAGFKSFVDSTTVPFPDQMTAIVGPNGCGKSNVIDAVRWVLGESSAKNLRGDAMTDVIFNGSTNRKPVSQASVELVFDNAEGKLQGNLASRSEISVKRVVNKEAQSTYFLNGSKCRRRDITDIFLGTGLGPRSYAIIEQGMISRLIESKPQELRIFIEEAAGISKYKERRRETENRIKHTRDNLSRLEDVREELGTQLEKLKRQAATARRYKELKSAERKYKAELYALKWHKYNEQLNVYEREKAEKETALEAFIAEQRGGELGLVRLKEQQTELNDQVQSAQQKVYQVGTHITRLEQQIVFTQEKFENQQEEQQQAELAIEEADSHLMMEQERLESLQEQADFLEPDLELATQQVEAGNELLLQSEEDYEQWQSQWAKLQRSASGASQSEQVIQTKLNHIKTNIDRLNQQRNQVKSELQSISASALEVQIAELDEQIERVSSDMELQQQSLAEIANLESSSFAEYTENKDKLEAVQAQLTNTKLQEQHLQSWYDKFANREDAAELLASEGIQQNGHVLTQLKADAQWQDAIEMLISQSGSPIIAERLPNSRIEVDLITPHQMSVNEGSIASKVIEGTYPAWFNNVAIANDIQHAKQLVQAGSHWHSAITITGEWLGMNWFSTGSSVSGESNVLSNIDKLEQLREARVAFELQLEQAQSALSDSKQRHNEIQTNKNNAEQAIRALESKLQGLVSEQKLLQQQKMHLTQQFEKLNAQIAHIEEELELMQIQQEELLMELEAQSEQGIALEQELEELELQKSVLMEAVNSNKINLETYRSQLHQLTLQHQNTLTQIDSVKSNVMRSSQHKQQLEKRLVELREQLSSGESPVVEMKMELEELLGSRIEAEEFLTLKQAELAEVADKVLQIEQGQSGILSKMDAMKAEIESIKLDSEGARIRAQNMLETLNDMEQPLKPVLENMPGEANEEDWSERLEKTTHSISRLGAINLAAIEEYDVQAERKQYLDEQYTDLTDALETLENAIRKIDRESRAKFKETYDKVNAGLQELFPKVFGGGSAYLELTADDLLETGVTIMARPPGKKNSTIHLLSGGEKALTALSLVFSIFRLNPAPFCMLDEVDAPLDDANVGRFCKLVSEMSATVQFIYISHNKVAMEMATHLTGVTMQEPGVSRLVAVDVQEAVKMAEAS
jgi:chromosome segregation protein